METVQNWARNLTYSACRLHAPESIEELRSLVKSSPRLKVLGTGHSFNTVGDTTGDLVSLRHFNNVVEVDPERGSVTVGAGIRYGDLAVYLHRRGLAAAQPCLFAPRFGGGGVHDCHPRLRGRPRQPGDGRRRDGAGHRRW